MADDPNPPYQNPFPNLTASFQPGQPAADTDDPTSTPPSQNATGIGVGSLPDTAQFQQRRQEGLSAREAPATSTRVPGPGGGPSLDLADYQATLPSTKPGPSGLSPFDESFIDFWHGKGMAPAGIAGMLGVVHQESGENGYAEVGDGGTSYGAYQHHLDRTEKLAAFAQEHNLSPWQPDAQNGFAAKELMPGGTHFDSAGKYLWDATDPMLAAEKMSRGFEVPSDPGTETARAQQFIKQNYGAIQGYLAQKAQEPTLQGTSVPQDTSAETLAFSKLQKVIGTPVGQGKFDTLPAKVADPQPVDTEGQALDRLNRVMATATPGQASSGAPAMPGNDWGSLGTGLGDFIRGAGHGLLTKIGLPADVMNFANHYFAEHPKATAMLSAGGGGGDTPPPVDWSGNNSQTQYINEQQESTPGAPGLPHIPLGTKDLADYLQYHLGIDTSQHGSDIFSNLMSHAGEFVGAGGSPGGIAKDAGAIATSPSTKTVAGAIFHHFLAPAGVSGGLDAADYATDQVADKPTADAIGIGMRLALGGAALGAAGRAAGARGALEDLAKPSAVADTLYAPEAGMGGPAARSKALAEISDFNPDTVAPGYQAPAYVRTADQPLQQLAQQNLRNNVELRGRLGENDDTIEAMRPQGNATDAATAVQNMQDTRQKLIEDGVDHVLQRAQQAQEIAQRGSNGQAMPLGAAGTANKAVLGQAAVDGLNDLRDAYFTHASEQWKVAEEQGLTSLQAPVSSTYSKIEGLMGDSIAERQGAGFPWDIVRDLYPGGNPQRALFTPLGDRIPGAQLDRLFTEGDTTIGQWRGVDTRIGNAIRNEQRMLSGTAGAGDPQRLRYLTQLHDVVDGAVKEGAEAGGEAPALALQTARDATKQAYGNFVTGGLSHVLSDRNGASYAPQAIQQFLGNGIKATGAAKAFQQAMTASTGADAITPAARTQHIWNTIGDWMRQDYLEAAADHGQNGAQRWMANKQGFFDTMKGNPVFDQLQAELSNHATMADPKFLSSVQGSAAKSIGDLQNNAFGLYLKGEGPTQLDTVFRAPQAKQGQMMQDLIGATQADRTGQAFQGLQRQFIDRVMLSAKQNDPLRPDQTYYSFGKAKEFLDGAGPAKQAMWAADPKWGQNFDRLVNTLVLEDRARAVPGLDLPSAGVPKTPGGQGLGTSLAQRLFQIGFSRMVGPLIEGHGMAHGMQAMGQASAYGGQLFQRARQMFPSVANKINALDIAERGRAALTEALMDTHQDASKMRAMLAPANGPSGRKWAAGIDPWLQAGGVMLPQGWLNPGGSDDGSLPK